MRKESITTNQYQQVKNIYLCNELKKQYEDMIGVKYDIVIRARFDLIYDLILDLSLPRLANNIVTIFSICTWMNGDDVLYYSTSENMDKAISYFWRNNHANVCTHRMMGTCGINIIQEGYIKRVEYRN